jgi:hypothetical protein
VEEKWKNILERVKSTGVYLFTSFSFDGTEWCVFQLISKLMLSIASIMERRLSSKCTYVFTAWLGMHGVIAWWHCPYRFFMNNVLEAWTMICLAGFSLIPACASHGKFIPASSEFGLTLLFVLVPWLAAVMWLWPLPKPTKPTKPDAEDPTVMTPVLEERTKIRFLRLLIPDITKLKRSMKDDKQEVRELGRDVNDDRGAITPGPFNDLLESMVKGLKNQLKDDIVVSHRSLQSLDSELGPENQKDWMIEVSHLHLAVRMTELYELIDIMLDGATTDLLTGLLSKAVKWGLLAMGFLVGAIAASSPPTGFLC